MWPWLAVGAGLGALQGGIQGYQRSGGNLGSTLQGALGGGVSGGLLSGVGLGATRFAGAALEGLLGGQAGARIAPEVYKASEALQGLKTGGLAGAKAAATQAGLQNPMTQQMLGRQLLPNVAKAGGVAAGIAAPLVVAPLADAAGNVVSGAAGGAGNLATQGGFSAYQGYKQGQNPYAQGATYSGSAAPIDPTQTYLNAATGYNPLGSYQTAMGLANQAAQQQALLANQAGNWQLQNADIVKQRDLQRGAASAALMTALGTQQGLILEGQKQGGAMANQAIADAGALARTQFNYFR
jgi:hypothetical protein